MAMRRLYELDDGVRSARGGVAVYGTGRMALLTFTSLLQDGVAVRAFYGDCGAPEIMGRPVLPSADVASAGCPVVWAGDDPERAESEMAGLGVGDWWVDARAYSMVNDCAWSFM